MEFLPTMAASGHTITPTALAATSERIVTHPKKLRENIPSWAPTTDDDTNIRQHAPEKNLQYSNLRKIIISWPSRVLSINHGLSYIMHILVLKMPCF